MVAGVTLLLMQSPSCPISPPPLHTCSLSAPCSARSRVWGEERERKDGGQSPPLAMTGHNRVRSAGRKGDSIILFRFVTGSPSADSLTEGEARFWGRVPAPSN